MNVAEGVCNRGTPTSLVGGGRWRVDDDRAHSLTRTQTQTKNKKRGAPSVGANFYASTLYLAPCTYITPHTHPSTYEFNVVSQGKLTWSMYPQGPAGMTMINGTATVGDLVMSPQGVPHLLYNGECEGLTLSHAFPSATTEDFVSLWATVADFPAPYLDNVLDGAAKGAPVDWIPMDPALGVLSVISVTKDAPHPNAGRLFLEFLMSEDGQKIYRDAEYLPVDPNVPPKDLALRPDGVKFRAIYKTPEDIDREMPRWAEIFKSIFR